MAKAQAFIGARPIPVLFGIHTQQTSPPGLVAPRVQLDPAALRCDQPLVLARDHCPAVALGLFSGADEPGPLAFA